MKRITLLLTASLSVLVSCEPTTSAPKPVNPLIGQWKIDSIAAADSNDFGVLLLAMSLQDSADYDMSFTTDSVLLHQKDTVTQTAYTINASQDQLLLKEDSSVFNIRKLDSNSIKLTDKDSTALFLRKRQ